LFWLLLLFALHLSPEPEVGSARLFMGLGTSMNYYRTAEVERGCWRSSSPTQMESDVQGHVQLSFQYLWELRLENLSGQPIPVFSYCHSKKEFSSV